MKLKALGNLGRGDKDLADARQLAVELEIAEVGGLIDLYVSVHRERPAEAVTRRLASVVERG